MASPSPPPGPDADAAFTLGIAASVVLAALAITFSVWTGDLTLPSAIVLLVLGLPTVFVVASCLLAVWLGYDRDAIDAYELADALREHTDADRKP